MKRIIDEVRPFIPSFLRGPMRRFKNSRAYRIFNPQWYKVAVGGKWEEMGRLQFDFLVEQGLKPESYLLDIGCGSLRGGIHFIRYLQPGHYFGIDMDKALLDAGRGELKRNNLLHKNPVLVQMGNFDLRSLNQGFDFALAQSVFTHLPLNSIMRCIVNMEKVLSEGGRFYATFFESRDGKFNLEPVLQSAAGGTDRLTYFDEDPYHYDYETFPWICEGTTFRVEYVGDWGHPENQKMLAFTKM